MRAVLVEKFGGPEVLTLADVPVPKPGPGEVSIEVAYAGVNFAELKARSSGYRVASLPHLPGLEVSGRIREVGDDVTGFRPGQEVAALTASGGYAEVAVASANAVFALPAGISLRVGATLPTVLPTAHALLHEVGRLRTGETVLVHGAAGGVGTVVGQLARHGGAAAVYGVVSSTAKVEHALKAGYDEVFVGDDFDDDVYRITGGRGVDLMLDPVGGDTFRRNLETLAPFGRLVSYGNASGAAPWQVGQIQLTPGRSVAGFSVLTLAKSDPALLREIASRAFQLVADGTVELPITAEFPLTEAAAAHRLMETRTTTGKLLLRIAD
ncbi:NADPH2:quinone reductase [Kitasatospora sp. MAP12-15]|uniref:quinone oxidoreductase family protein n=1 Tax=unclassified Kitasatospora TaxID=2633591 RepID=UPI002475EC63|nr:zinc-binding dehydrogenase [Kitasatospora sp. MAP12-44]MDH6113877.1 NADPH2:quinone reductase [Kitasatospora sp. MAP12-44]